MNILFCSDWSETSGQNPLLSKNSDHCLVHFVNRNVMNYKTLTRGVQELL